MFDNGNFDASLELESEYMIVRISPNSRSSYGFNVISVNRQYNGPWTEIEVLRVFGSLHLLAGRLVFISYSIITYRSGWRFISA